MDCQRRRIWGLVLSTLWVGGCHTARESVRPTSTSSPAPSMIGASTSRGGASSSAPRAESDAAVAASACQPVAYLEEPPVGPDGASAAAVPPGDAAAESPGAAAASGSTDGSTATAPATAGAQADAAALPLPSVEEVQAAPSGQGALLVQPEAVAADTATEVVMDDVVRSVRRNFPLIQAAIAARTIASGEALSALGAFDHKLEGESVSQPLSYYENYRQGIGAKRDTYLGGQLMAGYRVGRGDFEPWYQERLTNGGGEFKAGFMAPIVRDRWIDANRAALWQAQLERNRVEPEIRAQLILFVRDGAATYWDWVAAGANYRIARELLKLALVRQDALEEQVKAEEKAPIDLVDNRRIIVSREAKQIEAERKLRQAAVKLSLFLRDDAGVPVVLDATAKPPEFPPVPKDFTLDAADVTNALANRPELADLNFQRQQLDVALRQAENERLPDVDAGVLVSQDVGEPTSSKRDKSPAEIQALVTLSYAVEQRKALGKARAVQGKLAQLQAKTRFVEDKIVAEVRNSRLAIQAAVERVERARESFELAQRMLEAERDLFMEGQSTLLNLNLREGQAADAGAELVLANLDYHLANVDYTAALGLGQ